MQEAGQCQFLGHGIAADDGPGFQNQAGESRLPQIGSRNQTIVARSSYDDIKLFSHICLLSCTSAQIFSGLSGISMVLMPRGESASSTALTIAGGPPMQPDSPAPFAPSGL